MRLGIIGLPQSGKTTLFNALTRGDQPLGSRGVTGGGRFEVHTAVVSVPDPRVDALSALFKPRKTIYAQVTYADIAGLEAEASKSVFSALSSSKLAARDGFLSVGRVFETPTVPHPAGSINPARDL